MVLGTTSPRRGGLSLAVCFSARKAAVASFSSRQRRLNSVVADATWEMHAHHDPALKHRAKFRLPRRGRIRQHYFFITTRKFPLINYSVEAWLHLIVLPLTFSCR